MKSLWKEKRKVLMRLLSLEVNFLSYLTSFAYSENNYFNEIDKKSGFENPILFLFVIGGFVVLYYFFQDKKKKRK